MPTPFSLAAQRLVRARRWWLLGREPPFLARFAPPDLPTPDPKEQGLSAVRGWAVWREAERLDPLLTQLASVRLTLGPQTLRTPEVLLRLALETDSDTAEGLLKALSSAVVGPARKLGSAFARLADRAAGQGALRLVEPTELAAADALLRLTEEPVRDVLAWATLRAGRSRRARVSLPDVLGVLRAPALDDVFRPAADPWPGLQRWRAKLGFGLAEETGLEVSGPSAWFGSWALRGRERRVVGAAGWPGLSRLRFALQGLGRLDGLIEAGREVWLPADPSAVSLLPALYPLWLGEHLFQRRALGCEEATPDSARLAALAELLLQRLQAGVLKLWAAFDEAREVGAVLESMALLSRALGAPVSPEIGLLLAAPWTDGLSAWPRACFAAAALQETWREQFDVDYWRNPALVDTWRALASRTATEALPALVAGEGPIWEAAYARKVNALLGG